MRTASIQFCLALAMLAAPAGHAWGQTASAGPTVAPSFTIGLSSDHRRRGLSWSDGKPAIDASAYMVVDEHLSLSAQATTTRADPRNGGADAVIDLAARFSDDVGIVTLGGGLIGHVFPGGTLPGYIEVEASAATLIGPARFELFTVYAPAQAAIGGDNLYVGADASIALPSTGFSAIAGVGHSSGRRDDRAAARRRSARLRPDGAYLDYKIGIEHISGPLTIGLYFTGTTIDRSHLPYRTRHAGERLALNARIDF